jgi:hypothetical protein
MKFMKFSVMALTMAITFFSCKKDSDSVAKNTPTPGIEGKWIGKYGFGNETPGIFYSFNIKPGGVIEELNKSGYSKGSGTWNLNGTTFTATYQWGAPYYSFYSVSATYNEATHKLTGTWGYDNSATDGGLWEQTKQ